MPPTLVARASHGTRVEVPVPYHDVPVPTIAEVRTLASRVDEIAQSPSSKRVDITPLLDLCLRFACLAYRRNAPSTTIGLALHAPGAAPHGVELQFRTADGAHAVVYLFGTGVKDELHAVLSFKGSTLSSPAAPFLSDWVANLQPAAAAGDGDTHSGLVHSGWSAYLAPLVSEMRACMLPDCLPDAIRTTWGWPAHDRLSLWALFSTSRCMQTLVVGHSMGGALATLAATQLAREARVQQGAARTASRVTRNPAAGFVDGTLRALFASGSRDGCGSSGGGSSAAGTEPKGDDDCERVDPQDASIEGLPQSSRDATNQDAAAAGGTVSSLSALLGCFVPQQTSCEPERQPTTRPEEEEPGPSPAEGPVLITFGCPVVGDHEFVVTQRRSVRPFGGLRVYNENDPVASVGFGLLSLEAATGKAYTHDHGGLPVALINDALTRANPYTNHLRFCLDSDVVAAVPCLARYKLPGLMYNPEQNSSHLPPTPMPLDPEAQKHRARLEVNFDIPEPPWFRTFEEWGARRLRR